MCIKIDELTENIIEFLHDDSVIEYINEIDNYGKLLEKISKIQNFDTKEIVIQNSYLEAEYDYRRERISVTFKNLRLALKKYELHKQNLSHFHDESEFIKKEYIHIAGIICLVKWFSAIIRNHKLDNLTMTLGERIKNIKEMNISDMQMQIAELSGLKDQSRDIYKKISLSVA